MHYEASLLEVYLHNIFNGFSPFVYREKLYLAKHLSSADIFEANCYILARKEELKAAGCASEYDIIKSCLERGTWSRDNDARMSQLEKIIKNKQQTKEKLVMPSQVAQMDGEIRQFKKELEGIREEKQSLLLHSIEYKILLEKRDYLAYVGIRTPQGTHLWNSYESYLENEANFVEELTEKYYKTITEISNSVVRAVARETDARHKLEMCPMPKPTEMTVLLAELKQWCDFYTSIYELSDKPEQDIIQDDDKLDKWLIGRRLRSESEKSVNSGDGKGFTGVVGSRDDIDAMGGVSTSTIKDLAKKNG